MGALLLENQIWLLPKAKSCPQGRYKHTDRRQLLDKVVGNMNQVLVFMKTLLEPFALFIFQEIKVNSSIQEGLNQPLPRLQRWDLGSNCSTNSCPNHQNKFPRLLGFEAWQQLPARGERSTAGTTMSGRVSGVVGQADRGRGRYPVPKFCIKYPLGLSDKWSMREAAWYP